MPDVLRPQRPRLAEALAAVTALSAEYWAPRLEAVAGSGLEIIDGDDLNPDPCVTSWIPGLSRRTRGSAVLTIADPAEAWEALAARGVIPLEWVDDPRRAFHYAPRDFDTTEGTRVTYGGAVVYLAHPPTLAACVALASDPQGVTTAEALAREIADDASVRVVWRVARVLPHVPWPSQILDREHQLTAKREWWRRRLREGVTDLERDLLATGYALAAVSADAVVLVAPELET